LLPDLFLYSSLAESLALLLGDFTLGICCLMFTIPDEWATE
jgi:hypothetical protein